MDKFIKDAANFIKFMNEAGSTEEEKKIRIKSFINGLKHIPMTDEEKSLFVKDTVGTPSEWEKLGIVSQAKNIIRNEGPKPTDTSTGSKPTPKEDFVLKPILGPRSKFTEETAIVRQSLASKLEDFRIDYAKGIVHSIKFYSDLLEKSRGQFGMEKLVEMLERHIAEDNIELEGAMSIIENSKREEVLEYKNMINKKEDIEDISLSSELTKSEKKDLDKEPSIEEKNEIDEEEDTTYGASSIVDKYTH